MNSDLNQVRDLVVGLDAGGTRTRAVLADLGDGRTRGEGTAGPGNALTVPGPELADHLAEALARAVPEPLRGRVAAVAGGFAGTGHQRQGADEPGRVRARTALSGALARLGITAPTVDVHSDIETTFATAPGHPADGLVLVAGTGAVAARIAARAPTATSGGDGWLLGDDGSGFWIGRAAVRSALRAADGRGAPTVLARAVGRELGLPPGVLPPRPTASRTPLPGARSCAPPTARSCCPPSWTGRRSGWPTTRRWSSGPPRRRTPSPARSCGRPRAG